MSPTPLHELLWLTPLEALAVVLGTAGMYGAMVLLVRVLGPRMLSAMSSYDLAAVIAFGAILGRASLGEVPVLGGGLVALATLVVLQAAAGAVRVRRGGARAVATPPVLLMADGEILPRQLRRAHLTADELRSRLRLAGVHAYGEVAVALLEPTGAISVLRSGAPIDPLLLSGVVGAHLVPEHLLARVAVDPGQQEA